jgi:hypothetical protein
MITPSARPIPLAVSIAASRLPAWRFAALTAVAAIALSVFVYCPRFENWSRGYPYSWETFRGANFLMQCADPLRTDVEAAVGWRLLLPVVCHVLHLGAAALVVPWVGVFLLLATAAWRLEKLGLPRTDALLATFLTATTSATIIGLHWLGTNDAWVWTALCAIALGVNRSAMIACCLLAPWIDERFLIGLPLAATMRTIVLGFTSPIPARRLVRDISAVVAWSVPYVITRIVLGKILARDTGGNFLEWTWAHLHEWLPHVPLGWWEGMRMGWFLVLGALLVTAHLQRWTTNAIVWSALFGTILVMIVLAADLSRSAAIVTPAMLTGTVLLHRHRPTWTRRVLLGTLALNLILPAATVVSGSVLWHEIFPRHFGWF